MSEKKTFCETELIEVIDQDMFSEDSNRYFLLDLKIPTPEKAVEVVPKSNSSSIITYPSKLPKFGFLDMLERIHGMDLRINNPWFNPTASKRHWKARSRKRVRFASTEINSDCFELPWCQLRKENLFTKPGQLHSPTCRNANQETVDVLGQYAWQNRVFILENHMKNALILFPSSKTCERQLITHTDQRINTSHQQDSRYETDVSELKLPISDKVISKNSSNLEIKPDQSNRNSYNFRLANENSWNESKHNLPPDSGYNNMSSKNHFEFQMIDTPKFKKASSNCNYALEVNQEECEDSDVELDMLLDGLTKTSLHDHSTFSEDNYAMNINVHLDPSIISVQRPKIIGFRTLDESAGLLSPIKITHRSALGTMMSDKTRLKPTLFKHNSSNLQFQRFLFDTPSPHD